MLDPELRPFDEFRFNRFRRYARRDEYDMGTGNWECALVSAQNLLLSLYMFVWFFLFLNLDGLLLVFLL